MINQLLPKMMYFTIYVIIPFLTILPTTASAEKLSGMIWNQHILLHIQTPPQTGSETKTIVPGVGVGDFTLGMSKDDVLNRLGKPMFIYRGHEKYNLDNLPKEYRLHFDGIEFEINDDMVQDIRRPAFMEQNDFQRKIEHPDWFTWNLLTMDLFNKHVLGNRQ